MVGGVHAVTLVVAVCIGASAILLAAVVLRSSSRQRLLSVPATARCFVSGLLFGLGMLVMLPSALDALPQLGGSTSSQQVVLYFIGAAFLMFCVNHVLLEHQHGDAHGHAAADADIESCESCPAAAGVKAKLQFGLRPAHCPPCKKPAHCPPVRTPLTTSGSQGAATVADVLSVLLRAAPWTIHALIDGATLGTAQSTMVAIALAVCIALCSVQDVGTILVNAAANGATHRATLCTIALFAAGFPLGSLLTVALVSAHNAAAVLVPLHAGAGGIFLYMALFELAPPHAHGRCTNLRYCLAFASGVLLVLLSEAAEELVKGWALAASSTLVQTPSGRLADGDFWRVAAARVGKAPGPIKGASLLVQTSRSVQTSLLPPSKHSIQ